SPWWWRGSTTRWCACWRSGFPRCGGGCYWGLGLVVRPGTRSIDALPGLKTGALRTNLVADGFRARLDEGSFRAQKKGALTALWGPFCSGYSALRRGHTPTVGVGGAVTVGSCALPPPPQ